MNRKVSAVLAFAAASGPSAAWAQTSDAITNGGIGVIAWLLVGLIAGYLASHVVNRSGEGMILDIVLGIVGAFIGGIIFRTWVLTELQDLMSGAFS
jgi:uncharacterized membrane protein YeaQ/YmgE (transglycosylase-associated protein family)